MTVAHRRRIFRHHHCRGPDLYPDPIFAWPIRCVHQFTGRKHNLGNEIQFPLGHRRAMAGALRVPDLPGWFHLLRRMFWISGLPGREQRKSHLDTESSGGREHTNAGVRLRLYATRLRQQSILPAGGDACAAVALRTGETVPEPGAQEPRRPRLVRPSPSTSTSKGRLRSSSFSKISRWVFAQAMMRRFGAFQSPRV